MFSISKRILEAIFRPHLATLAISKYRPVILAYFSPVLAGFESNSVNSVPILEHWTPEVNLFSKLANREADSVWEAVAFGLEAGFAGPDPAVSSEAKLER